MDYNHMKSTLNVLIGMLGDKISDLSYLMRHMRNLQGILPEVEKSPNKFDPDDIEQIPIAVHGGVDRVCMALGCTPEEVEIAARKDMEERGEAGS